MAEDDFEKTEAPTARRRQEARQEGNIARSTDLNAAVALLAAVVLLHIFGLKVFTSLKLAVESMLAPSAINPTRVDDLHAFVASAGRYGLVAAAPIVLGISAVGLLINVTQTGLLVTGKPLEFNLAKLSPLRGLRRLFDARSGIRLVMSLVKLSVVLLVAGVVIMDDLPKILMLAQLEVGPLFAAACELVYALALKLAGLLIVLAILDYAYQRWQHEKDLRMSKQEVKEEMRRMEGDPLIKQRRARVARQLALQRIGMAVPQADVIVTNPTHYAVALQYDADSMKAPKVVAKGADFLALRIRQLAMQHGVPMVERRELAQGLYKHVEVGQEVPPQFYNAVAEILAYVYRLSGRKIA